ncbi:MAG: autotransporter domain-containing protein, partial [Alphaproteobacteria bacterium]|nr:autotransporter domain-containing protein [Alphaproteobacteria bacterium]
MQNLFSNTPKWVKKKSFSVLKKCFLLNVMFCSVIIFTSNAYSSDPIDNSLGETLPPYQGVMVFENLNGAVYNAAGGSIIFDENSEVTFQNNTGRDLSSIENEGNILFSKNSSVSFTNNNAIMGTLLNSGSVVFDEGSNVLFQNNDGGIFNSGDIVFNGDVEFKSNISRYIDRFGAILNDAGSITFNGNFNFQNPIDITICYGDINFAHGKDKLGILTGGIVAVDSWTNYQINKTGEGTLIFADSVGNNLVGDFGVFFQTAGLTIGKANFLAQNNVFKGHTTLETHGSRNGSNLKIEFEGESEDKKAIWKHYHTDTKLFNISDIQLKEYSEVYFDSYSQQIKDNYISMYVKEGEENILFTNEAVSSDTKGYYALYNDIAQNAGKVSFKNSVVKPLEGNRRYVGDYTFGENTSLDLINKSLDSIQFEKAVFQNTSLMLNYGDTLQTIGGQFDLQSLNVFKPIVRGELSSYQALKGEATYLKSATFDLSGYYEGLTASVVAGGQHIIIEGEMNVPKTSFLTLGEAVSHDGNALFDMKNEELLSNGLYVYSVSSIDGSNNMLPPIEKGIKFIMGSTENANESIIQANGYTLFDINQSNEGLTLQNLTIDGAGEVFNIAQGVEAILDLNNVIIKNSYNLFVNSGDTHITGDVQFISNKSMNPRMPIIMSIDNLLVFNGKTSFIENEGRISGNGSIIFNDEVLFLSNKRADAYGVLIGTGSSTFNNEALFVGNEGRVLSNGWTTVTFYDNFTFTENEIDVILTDRGGRVVFAPDEGKVGTLDGGIDSVHPGADVGGAPGAIVKTNLGTLILGDNMNNICNGVSCWHSFIQEQGVIIVKTDKLNFASTNTITGGELRLHGDSLSDLKASVDGAKLTYLTTNTANQEAIIPSSIRLNNTEILFGAYTAAEKQSEVDLVKDRKVPSLDENGNVVYDEEGNIQYETYKVTEKLLTSNTIDRANYTLSSDISGATKVTFKDSDVAVAGGTYNLSYTFDNARLADNYDSLTFNAEMIFKNGDADAQYGAAFFNGNEITFVEKASFLSNAATYGGAIYNTGDITFGGNVDFSSNFADGDDAYGGAIYNYAYNSNATITFGEGSTATFTGNTASYDGGAIYNDGDMSGSGTITFGSGSTATFTGNKASKYGGAIWNDRTIRFGEGSTATFTGNTASSEGGAIWNAYGGTITFGSGSMATFSGNTASQYGGAIYNYRGTIITFGAGSTATFSGNTASASAGAIYNHYAAITFGAGSTATFSGNTASREGGAIYNEGIIMFGGDTTFTGNTASRYGGAINNRGTITFNDSFLFSDNTVSGSDAKGSDIYNYNVTITIANKEGTVGSLDGGIYQSNGVINKTGEGTLILGDLMANGYEEGTTFEQKAGLTIAKTDKLNFAASNTISGGELRIHGNNLSDLTASVDGAKLTYLTTNTANQEAVIPSSIGLNNTEILFGAYTTAEKQSEVDLVKDRKVPSLDEDGNIVYDEEGNIQYEAYKVTEKLLTSNTIDRANYTLSSDISGASKVTFINSDIRLGGDSYSGDYDIGSSNKLILSDETITEKEITFKALSGEGAVLEIDALFTQNEDGTVSMQTDKLVLSGSEYQFGDVELNMMGNDIFKATVDQMAKLSKPVLYQSQALGGGATFKDVHKSWLETTSPYAYELQASGQELSVGASKLKGTALEYLVSYESDTTLQMKKDTEGASYIVGDNESFSIMAQGEKKIIGATDKASESTLVASGKNLFTLNDENTSLEVKNITIKESNNAIDNQKGQVILENVVIENSIGDTALKNAGTMTLQQVTVDKGIENKGILTLSNENNIALLNNEQEGIVDLLSAHQLKEVVNDGQINTSHNIGMESLSGIGQLTVNNAVLDVADKFQTSNKVISNNMKIGEKVKEIRFGGLEIKEGTMLDIDNKHVEAEKVTFGKDSTLSVTLNHLKDHGTLSHEEVAGDEEAKLILKLTEGINQEEGIYKVFNKDNQLVLKENKLINVIDNQDGSYKVAKKSVDDLSKDLGTTKEESSVANALLDGNGEKEEFVQVQTEILDALQSENQATFAKAKKALNAMGSGNTSIYQAQATAHFTQMHAVISQMLMNTSSGVFGHSGGEEKARATVYAKGLYDRVNSLTGSGFRMRSKGAVLGIQSELTNEITVGIGYAATNTIAKEEVRRTDVDTNTGFISAQYQPNDWWMSGVLSYSRSQYEEEKEVMSFKGKSSYNVDSLGVQINTGYNVQIGDWIITPEIGVRYINAKQESYEDSFGTRVEGTNSDYLTAMAGFKVGVDLGIVRPLAGIMVGYDIISDDIVSINTLANGAMY